jgi:hypothetical protein
MFSRGEFEQCEMVAMAEIYQSQLIHLDDTIVE